MAAYEYRVIPAPAKAGKVKGAKTPEERFSLMLQDLMNELGRDGWEYQRAETLPATERAGLTGSTTNWRHVLVFRRVLKPQETAQPTEIPAIYAGDPTENPPEFRSAPLTARQAFSADQRPVEALDDYRKNPEKSDT